MMTRVISTVFLLLFVALLLMYARRNVGAAEPTSSGIINERQRIIRYIDQDADIICYALTNRNASWYYDISCLPADQVKDIPND